MQVDGNNDSDSEDDCGLNDPSNVWRNNTRPHLDPVLVNSDVEEDNIEDYSVTDDANKDLEMEEDLEENLKKADVNTWPTK